MEGSLQVRIEDTWVEAFATLSKGVLYYYECKQGSRTDVQLGKIAMKSASCARIGTSSGFEVVLGNKTSRVLFKAARMDEVDKWVTALQEGSKLEHSKSLLSLSRLSPKEVEPPRGEKGKSSIEGTHSDSNIKDKERRSLHSPTSVPSSSTSSPQSSSLMNWMEALSIPAETKSSREGSHSKRKIGQESARVVAVPKEKEKEKERETTLSDILQIRNSEEAAKAVRQWAEKSDLTRRAGDGWTVLHEACNAFHVAVIMELLKFKVPTGLKSNDGNIPLHYLAKLTLSKAKQEDLNTLYLTLINAMLKSYPKSILDTENDRGETPLFRATSVGNYVLVNLLLQNGADPILSFLPEDKVGTQSEPFLVTQSQINTTKFNTAKAKANTKKRIFFIKDSNISTDENSEVKFPSTEFWVSSILKDPLVDSTIQSVHSKFMQAHATSNSSWSPMQFIQLNVDRVSSLKEERGRYYIGFARNQELLQALRDSFTLVNTSEKPLRWSIAKYFPELSSYNSSSLRFEILGKRKGLLQPGAQEKINVSLLATTATEFLQLIAVEYSDDTNETAPARAVYFFLAANMKPPNDLKDLEVDPSLLPNLEKCAGIGGSASVYRVANFLPTKTSETFLAVKKFSYKLEGGVEEHSEDFRRFKLELYISAKMHHPNIVKTFGFIGYPPCLIMEFIDNNLRQLLDNPQVELSMPSRMRLALQIAKGMQYLHSLEIIHRDLKPENVLVTSHFDAKVADFGISMAGELLKTPSQGGQAEGTQFYMSPELISGDKDYSIESDVYSYGIILYEILKKANLSNELNLHQLSRIQFMTLRASGDPPLKAVEGLDSTMKAVVEGCWIVSPRDRFSFSEIVVLLADHRKNFLHLDLDAEFEEAREESNIHALFQNWNKRLVNADESVEVKFRDNFNKSKALENVLNTILSDDMEDEELTEIETLFEHVIGNNAAELVANLRAIFNICHNSPTYPSTKKFLLNVLPPSIARRTTANPPTDEDVQSWITLLESIKMDQNAQLEITKKRFGPQKQALEKRIAELQNELAKCNKQLVSFENAPDSLTYFSNTIDSENMPMTFPLKILQQTQDKILSSCKQLDSINYATLYQQKETDEAKVGLILWKELMDTLRDARRRLDTLKLVFAPSKEKKRLKEVEEKLEERIAYYDKIMVSTRLLIKQSSVSNLSLSGTHQTPS